MFESTRSMIFIALPFDIFNIPLFDITFCFPLPLYISICSLLSFCLYSLCSVLSLPCAIFPSLSAHTQVGHDCPLGARCQTLPRSARARIAAQYTARRSDATVSRFDQVSVCAVIEMQCSVVIATTNCEEASLSYQRYACSNSQPY
jgi:hypothetical protein